ncbi:MAG: uroporphyrinogen decarboxylase [Thermoleophilia bacterium]
MTADYRFLRACRREEVDRTPVWMMRQAGRYLQEYRALRAKHSFLEMCRTPELAAEVTLQPLRRFAFDAAIIFADILLPLPGMGIDLTFAKGEGPVIGNPVRTAADVEALRPLDPEAHVPFLAEAIRIVRRELAGKVPLIGFSGAPFTLASYVLEGGGSKNFVATKTLMYGEPRVWHRFMEKMSDVIVTYLEYQVAAGAQALQLFDSWVGILSPADYREFVLPYSQRVIGALAGTVPLIHFGTDTATLLPAMKEAGADVLGVDWRVDLADAWALVGEDVGLQGNLDPITLYAPPEVIEARVRRVLESAGGRRGHIFNLGHGVLPTTPPEHVGVMVDAVQRLSARRPAVENDRDRHGGE